jgi:uncharacterized membrane protein YphA (DoxX/SURF4 family)
MKKGNPSSLLPAILSILRILVGWHFLYEGLSKLAMDGWSSSSYLMQSNWLLSGFFHWIIAHPIALEITDFLNVWGLILIGAGLFLGIFIRLSGISGIILLMLYYIANPPFMSTGVPGQYYIINMNLVEAGILLVFVLLSKEYLWSLDRLLELFKKRKAGIFPPQENMEAIEPKINSRRELIRNLAAIPLFGISFFGMAKKVGWLSHEEDNLKKTDAVTSATIITARNRDLRELKEKVPAGKIKDLVISRMMPGGNLVAGFAHARDLIYVSPLIKNYFTDEKVIETLWLYEACGMNTVVFRTDEQTIRILKEFWRRGGKMQWLAQVYPQDDDLTNVKQAIDTGAVGAFVMGGISDKLVAENRMEFLAKPIEYIRSQGLIGGTAAHSIEVPMRCVENGIEVDFFMKTFHHDQYWSAHPQENRSEFMHNLDSDPLDRTKYHDNLWCANSEKVIDFFRKNTTPWIAYKVLAAGAIKPEDGFKYAFENGADFICVGMFDFQIIPNANTVTGILNSGISRERTWFA